MYCIEVVQSYAARIFLSSSLSSDNWSFILFFLTNSQVVMSSNNAVVLCTLVSYGCVLVLLRVWLAESAYC